jgi:hypothetical protein
LEGEEGAGSLAAKERKDHKERLEALLRFQRAFAAKPKLMNRHHPCLFSAAHSVTVSIFIALGWLLGTAFAQTPSKGGERFVAAPGPEVFADSILQEAIDEQAAKGGGVVVAVDTVAVIAIVETAAAVVDTTDINLLKLPIYKSRSEIRTRFFYSYI